MKLVYPIKCLSILLILFSCSKDNTDPIKYFVTISASEGGTVSTEGGSYELGSTLSVTAIPESEFIFIGWSNGSTENPLKLTVNSNQTITANFTKRKYALNISIQGEGTVTEQVINSGKDYDSGTVVRLTAIANEGWEFNGWEGSIESTESSIDLTINEVKNINAVFTLVTFITNSERYSSINETTSFFKGQQYVSNYLSKEYIQDYVKVDYNGECQWLTFHRNIGISDFNGDNKPDIIAFANSFCDYEDYASRKGKFIFISDYLGTSQKEIYDSDHFFGSGDMTVNDYNNDGINEVLFFATDAKTNLYNEEEDFGGGTNIPPKEPALLYYDNGLKIKYFGDPADSAMGTSGDIDNDGDIDFIQWAQPTVYNNVSVEYTPTVQLNNGDLTFTKKQLVLDYPSDWSATSAELFDINDDGFLDLIVGWRIGIPKWNEIYPNFFNSMTGPKILYGDGTGQFSISNSVELSENTLSSKNIAASILGYGFTDFDLDGDIDIILTTTRDEPGGTFEDGTYYDNYYLVFFENQNGSFVDTTESTIIGSYNQTREFPNFYKLRLVDLDQDGDVDILPDAIANWGTIEYYPTLRWIKELNVFIRNN